MKQYYDKKYYSWQKKSGDLGGLIDLWKFQPYIKTSDTVLDFGCGGGNILEKIHCKKKFGIEINPFAAAEAQKKGIIIFKHVDEIPSKMKFDVIISHHALEHIDNPAETLKKLRNHLKKTGVTVHVVPINDWRNDKTFNPIDINKHLYAWTPLLLGNLLVHCGYSIQKVEILTHAWAPLSFFIYPYLPKPLYHLFCNIWSTVTRNRQMIVIAYMK